MTWFSTQMPDQTNMMFNYFMSKYFYICALCTVAAVTLLPHLCSVLFKSFPPFEKKRVMEAGRKERGLLEPHIKQT